MLVVSKEDRHAEWRPHTILGSPDRCRLDRPVASHRSGPRYYPGTTPSFPIKRKSLREAESVRRVGLPGAATHELRTCCPLGNASPYSRLLTERYARGHFLGISGA